MDHHDIVIVLWTIADTVKGDPRPIAMDGIQQIRTEMARLVSHIHPPFPGHSVDSDMLCIPTTDILKSRWLGRDGELAEELAAPVEAGQELGRMTVSSGGEILTVIPLVAERAVERCGYPLRTI